MFQVNAVGDLCAICQEKMHAPIILRCKHIFCEDCVSEWSVYAFYFLSLYLILFTILYNLYCQQISFFLRSRICFLVVNDELVTPFQIVKL